MYVASEHFMSPLIIKYGKHSNSIDGDGTWYPQACKFLKLEHHLHFLYTSKEKGIIERTMQ